MVNGGYWWSVLLNQLRFIHSSISTIIENIMNCQLTIHIKKRLGLHEKFSYWTGLLGASNNLTVAVDWCLSYLSAGTTLFPLLTKTLGLWSNVLYAFLTIIIFTIRMPLLFLLFLETNFWSCVVPVRYLEKGSTLIPAFVNDCSELGVCQKFFSKPNYISNLDVVHFWNILFFYLSAVNETVQQQNFFLLLYSCYLHFM